MPSSWRFSSEVIAPHSSGSVEAIVASSANMWKSLNEREFYHVDTSRL
jgi:hypothetical protein